MFPPPPTDTRQIHRVRPLVTTHPLSSRRVLGIAASCLNSRLRNMRGNLPRRPGRRVPFGERDVLTLQPPAGRLARDTPCGGDAVPPPVRSPTGGRIRARA